MSIQIYNTLSKRKEEFKPLEPGKVKMYVCGPTVYNLIHIGNARPMIVFDTVRRYMEYKGYEVNYVSNFTDVDDKIIKKANEEGVEPGVISERYIAECKKDMEGMNIKPATKNPKATEEIGGMLDMIQTLIDKGHAYVAADGTVYFRTRSFKDYGKLSHKNLDDLQGGNRSLLVSGEDQKEDPLDFVLWKPKKEGEPYWDSCWCQGRPGWHIECSGISMKYNGEYLDLHCGGVDNAFPHHTNEIAQSESYLGHPWCLQWCHVAHLNTSHGKMSKSKGEFLTVSLLEEKGYDPLAYRFFCLQSHYRKSLVFTWENLDNAVAAYNKLIAKIANIKDEGGVDEAVRAEYRAKFMKEMDNDLNTAMGVTALYDVLKAKTTGATKLAIIGDYDTVLSLDLLKKAEAEREKKEKAASQQSAGGFTVVSEDGTADEGIENLIRQRAEAKKAKNFAEADRIRDELKAQGVEVTDMPGGAKWKRV